MLFSTLVKEEKEIESCKRKIMYELRDKKGKKLSTNQELKLTFFFNKTSFFFGCSTLPISTYPLHYSKKDLAILPPTPHPPAAHQTTYRNRHKLIFKNKKIDKTKSIFFFCM